MKSPIQRRTLLQSLMLAPLAILLPRLVLADAGKKPANALTSDDMMAKAMKYSEDANKADKTARTDKTAKCSNCAKYAMCSPADTACKPGDKKAAWATCEIFAGKEVSKNGWCLSWTKA
jgi:hypothetical protein